jgi:hypothetical protein
VPIDVVETHVPSLHALNGFIEAWQSIDVCRGKVAWIASLMKHRSQ